MTAHTPWGPVGYITYKRTYARPLPSGRTEEYPETLSRCIEGLHRIGVRFDRGESEALYDYLLRLKCMLSGRSLWQLGTSTVDKIGGDSLQSCWTVAVREPQAFTFAFEQLMLGGGIGFNIEPKYVYELPEVKSGVKIKRLDTNDVGFIVPDNREGWCELLNKVLHAYFYTGKGFTYSTACIRSKGSSIKSFGGMASGPDMLVYGISQITNILRSRVGRKLRPVDCLDIMNIIGMIVVSGNVRRSAQIALCDANNDFLSAKRWDLGNIPNWRAMSNNTVITSDIDSLPQEFWEGYLGNGEPYGLLNLDLCRYTGRTKFEYETQIDNNVIGVNPCGEITLEGYESCNLSEIFLPNVEDLEEFKHIASLLYKVCKGISNLGFIYPQTNAVVGRNHRLGISVTGLMQSSWSAEDFDTVYKHLRTLDAEYSYKYNMPESIKLTTVKPSGTVSLLPGVTPGIHGAYSNYYIRRIRMASNDPLVNICKEHGFKTEPVYNFDGSVDHTTNIVEFPVDHSNAVQASDFTAIQQLETQKMMQQYWSDNAVSVTVYYHDDELPGIQEWLKENYSRWVKSVSFLRHQDHGFKQAPYESITKEKYDELIKGVTPITSTNVNTYRERIDEDCESGVCPTR